MGRCCGTFSSKQLTDLAKWEKALYRISAMQLRMLHYNLIE